MRKKSIVKIFFAYTLFSLYLGCGQSSRLPSQNDKSKLSVKKIKMDDGIAMTKPTLDLFLKIKEGMSRNDFDLIIKFQPNRYVGSGLLIEEYLLQDDSIILVTWFGDRVGGVDVYPKGSKEKE